MVRFEPRSARVGWFSVTGETADGVAVARESAREFRFGGRVRPRFRLVCPETSDEGWQIGPAPDGDDPVEPPLAGPWVEPWLRWLAGTAAVRGHGLPALLPSGDYVALRTPRRPVRTDRVLLGNEWVPAAPNLVALSEVARGVYFAVVGPDPRSAPDMGQPLLGLGILGYNGTTALDGLVSFPMFAGPSEAPDGDLVLLAPLTNDLVLRTEDRTDESVDRWRDRVIARAGEVD